MLIKRILNFLLAVALLATVACGSSSTQTESGVSGTASDGLAMSEAAITIQYTDADGVDQETDTLATTDADGDGRYSGITIPDAVTYPARLTATTYEADGVTVKRQIFNLIVSAPSAGAIFNVNPVTDAVSTQAILNAGGMSLVTNELLEAAGKAVLDAVFGADTVDWATFATLDFAANTAASPDAGGFADLLIDAIKLLEGDNNVDERLLAIFTGGLDTYSLDNASFQASLVQAASQGDRAVADVSALISAAIPNYATLDTLLARTAAMADATFMAALADEALTATEKAAVLDSFVTVLDQELANAELTDAERAVIASNMAQTVGPALVTEVKGSGLTGTTLTDWVTEMANTVTAAVKVAMGDDLTAAIADLAVLQTAANNSANAVQAAVGIGGTGSDGLAMALAAITITGANDVTENLGTTDASGKYTNLNIPATITFPALLTITSAEDSTRKLTAMITSAPTAGATFNVNPVTAAISAATITENGGLANVTPAIASAKAKAMITEIFGEAATFENFATETFEARTEDNPKGGGLADALIDAIAGLDSGRSVEDLLASAADSEDATVATNLLADPAFQAKLAGELIAQGRSAEEANLAIQSSIPDDFPGKADMVTNTQKFTEVFEEVSTTANGEFEGGASQAQREAIIGAFADVVVKTVDESDATGDTLANVLRNSKNAAADSIIAVAKENKDVGDLKTVMRATAGEMADVLNDEGFDMTAENAVAEDATVVNKLKNYGKALASAVVQNFESTDNSKADLSPAKKKLMAKQLAKGVGSGLDGFLNDGSFDTADADLSTAKNTAKNIGVALDESLTNMIKDDNAANQGSQFMDAMAESLVTQTMTELLSDTTIDLTSEPEVFKVNENVIKAKNKAKNMASVALNNIASMEGMENMSQGQKGAIARAMTNQLIEEVKAQGLDMTGDAIPETVNILAGNMTKTVGKALVVEVAKFKEFKGDEMKVLALSVASEASDTLKEQDGFSFIVAIDDSDLETLQGVTKTAAAQQNTNMQDTFREMEADDGINFADMAKVFLDSGLAGKGIESVVTQVRTAIKDDTAASGSMLGAVNKIAKASADMAKAVLNQGGSLDDVQDAVNTQLATIASTDTTGMTDQEKAKAYKDNAQTLGKLADSLGKMDMSVEDMLNTAKDAQGTLLTNGTDAGKDVLKVLQKNLDGQKKVVVDYNQGDGTGEKPVIGHIDSDDFVDGIIDAGATGEGFNLTPQELAAINALTAEELLTITGLTIEYINALFAITGPTPEQIEQQKQLKKKAMKSLVNDQVGAIDDKKNDLDEKQPKPPMGNPGGDQIVSEGAMVTLTANATDEDGTIASIVWALEESNPAGVTVTLADANTAAATFTAPEVDQDTTLTFRLTVTDDEGEKSVSFTKVKVINIVAGASNSVMSIADATAVMEGAEGAMTDMVFVVSLDAPAVQTTTVRFMVTSDSAVQDVDYMLPIGDHRKFEVGEQTKNIVVKVKGNDQDGPNKTITVTLSDPLVGTLGKATASGIITDDDEPGTTGGTYTPVLPTGGNVSFTVTAGETKESALNASDSNGTNVACVIAANPAMTVPQVGDRCGFTYTAPAGAGGTTETATYHVTSMNDFDGDGTFTDVETSETYTVTFNITAAPTAGIMSITGPMAPITEGASGTTANMVFTVSLDKALQAVTVNYATSSVSANADDYTGVSGTLTFNASETATSQTITVVIKGDNLDEANEDITVTLSEVVGATLSGGATTLAATGTIQDDDDAPTVSFAAPSATIAETADVPATVTLNLSAASTLNISVPVTISGTATLTTDYVVDTSSDQIAVEGSTITVTIPAGSTTASTTLDPVKDIVTEGDETAILTIGQPTYAVASTTAGVYTLTINNKHRFKLSNKAVTLTDYVAGVATPQTITVTNTDRVMTGSATKALNATNMQALANGEPAGKAPSFGFGLSGVAGTVATPATGSTKVVLLLKDGASATKADGERQVKTTNTINWSADGTTLTFTSPAGSMAKVEYYQRASNAVTSITLNSTVLDDVLVTTGGTTAGTAMIKTRIATLFNKAATFGAVLDGTVAAGTYYYEINFGADTTAGSSNVAFPLADASNKRFDMLKGTFTVADQ